MAQVQRVQSLVTWQHVSRPTARQDNVVVEPREGGGSSSQTGSTPEQHQEETRLRDSIQRHVPRDLLLPLKPHLHSSTPV